MTARSARLSVLLSRDTLIGAAVVALAMAICVGLGLWQYGRFEDRRDRVEAVEYNYSAEPVPLDEALTDPEQPLDRAQEWTPVELHGSYCADPDCAIYVRNRTLGGSVGFVQLAPFHTDDGRTVLVARGWVEPHAQQSRPADPPPVPEGEMSVTVRLRPAEGVFEDRDTPQGQAHSIAPAQIAEQLPDSDTELVTGAYGALAAEEPEAPAPQPLAAPDTSLGPHLSYAFQWWIFALFFPGALVVRTYKVMQEAVEDAEGDDQGPAPPARRAPAARPRRRSRDEEDEDALIDNQL